MPVVAKYGLGARLWDTHSGFYVDIFTWKPYGWVEKTAGSNKVFFAAVAGGGSGGDSSYNSGTPRALASSSPIELPFCETFRVGH